MFQKPLITLAALSGVASGIVAFVFMFFDPLYLRIIRGLPPFTIGLLVAVIPAAQTLNSIVFPRCVKMFGVGNLLIFSTCAAFIGTLLHQWIGYHTPLLYLIIPFFILGINWGLSNSGMLTAANEAVQPKKIGEAIGTIATMWNISGSIFLAISTAIYHAREMQTDSFFLGYHSMVHFNIVVMAVFVVCAFFYSISDKKSCLAHQIKFQ